ncbi:MAG: flagellar biosynthetic protein FliR [Mariprofundaceae bacterium]
MFFPVPPMQEIMAGMLIFLRVSTMMILLPVLGHNLVPNPVKAGLIALLTILLYPVVAAKVPAIPPEPLILILFGLQEILVAGILAMLGQLIFSAVQFSGQVMSYQMGMAIANVFDPATSAQGAVIAQLASVLAVLMWLAVGAHHTFILALVESFTLLPIGSPWSFSGWEVLNDATAQMFVLALRLVAPVLLLLFFVYVALGLISRAVPQIQVFFVSFPLTVGLGLLTFALALPAYMSLVHDGFAALSHDVPYLLRKVSGN